jgi:hypothetical protein
VAVKISSPAEARSRLSVQVAALQALRPPASATALEGTIRCLEGQRARLGDYAAWREAGYPIGSGLIERAVALVNNRRLQGRGM